MIHKNITLVLVGGPFRTMIYDLTANKQNFSAMRCKSSVSANVCQDSKQQLYIAA